MSNSLFSLAFNEIFEDCRPFVLNDFNGIKGQKADNNNGTINFCLSTYKKIFDEAIKKLDKIKYNGRLVLTKEICFDGNITFKTEDVIKKSTQIIKDKARIIENTSEKLYTNEIKLTKSLEHPDNEDKNTRIVLIPISEISALYYGIDAFSIVLAHQTKNEENDNDDKNSSYETNTYTTQFIAVYNPIQQSIYTFDLQNGCRFNGQKMIKNNIGINKKIASIFVNNYTSNDKQLSFNITKLAQISNYFTTSNDIFLSICLLASTNINLCFCKIPDNYKELVEFMIKSSYLSTKQLNDGYIAVGTEKELQQFIK